MQHFELAVILAWCYNRICREASQPRLDMTF